MPGRLRWRVALWLGAFLAAVPCARAEDPYIGYVYPAGAGGLLGAETEIVVGGRYLGGVSAVLFTGDGIDAMAIGYNRPLTAQELAARRAKLAAAKSAKDAGDPASMMMMKASGAADPFKSIEKDLGLDRPNPTAQGPTLEELAEAARAIRAKNQPNPQLAEAVRLYVTVAPGAEPGVRELRLKAGSGVSNPVYFHVGKWEEYREREPNDRTPDGGVPAWMPVVINGQIMPGDVDRFRFRATKGTRLVAAVSARSLIPYLADAVPGWFQATLALFDEEGNRLAYTDDFRFSPDPVIYYEVPRTGRYVLEIRDAIYRGREDFVYRIALGEVPFLTGMFPMGGRAGKKTTVALAGWNLLSHTLTVDARALDPGVLQIPHSHGWRAANHLSFVVDTLPECLDEEPNNEPRSAQRMGIPQVVNGHIDRPGDWDVFRFDGHAGQGIVAEVQARRLGSPVDSLLKLTDADGRFLAANDDHEDKSAALTTHQADSRLSFTLPRNGAYLLHLGETQHKGGPAYAYRLRISPRRPDFELRVVPSSLNAVSGTTVPISVFALRKDGFTGPIRLNLDGWGRGFTLSGARIPAGQDEVRLTLTVPSVGRSRPVRLGIEGRAVIDGKEVRRRAVPADEVTQAFIYRHLVPAEYWMVSLMAARRYETIALTLADSEPVRLPVGGTAPVRLEAVRLRYADQIKVELSEPPEGIVVRKVSPDGTGLAVVLGAEEGKAKPGLEGNLIARAVREYAVRGTDGELTGDTRRIVLGTIPAIAFEVVPAAPETAPAGVVASPRLTRPSATKRQ